MIEFGDDLNIQRIINKSVAGKNTSFLKASHSLWTRFKNYEKNPPCILYVDKVPVSVIFATCSTRTKYINLYEIVTIQGQERKGYANKIWSEFIKHWHKNGMSRIKLSCTPESIGFHKKNGLVFWSVDKQGSLRSDQPLMPTIAEQIVLREKSISKPSLVIPNIKICNKLKKEDIEFLNLSNKKLLKTYEAIQSVDKFWLRKALYD
jgi:hypothetical protein|tara:strand:+ start:594 stop:1211 length:618 start_codon:yes stop_codon:yes gene_type:complete